MVIIKDISYLNRIIPSEYRVCTSYTWILIVAKLQNTPQLISASLTCVGRLWRSRHNTIDAILIQWHVNELRGILKLLLNCYYGQMHGWFNLHLETFSLLLCIYSVETLTLQLLSIFCLYSWIKYLISC